MSVAELQTDIIQKLLSIQDEETLVLFKEMLASLSLNNSYKVTEFERNLIMESIADYKSGNVLSNDDVFKKNEEWLNE